MGSNPPPMAIRVRTKFQSLEVFPMDCYADFFGYLQSEYPTLCELLEPSVSVKTKEEVATALVHIMQKQGLATEFVTELVMNDVQKIGAYLLSGKPVWFTIVCTDYFYFHSIFVIWSFLVFKLLGRASVWSCQESLHNYSLCIVFGSLYN